MFNRILAFVTITLAATLTVALPAATLTGCPQPITVTNAIQAAQEASQTAATVVADAQVVWPIVYAAIPAANQAAAQTAFNEGLFTANHAILALNDAIAVAIAANTPNADFSAVLSQLSNAVAQIVAIVEQFMTPAIAPHAHTAGGVDAVGDMSAAAGRLKALTVKK
jgi:hypothetical protein